jgi:hypothetical protein
VCATLLNPGELLNAVERYQGRFVALERVQVTYVRTCTLEYCYEDEEPCCNKCSARAVAFDSRPIIRLARSDGTLHAVSGYDCVLRERMKLGRGPYTVVGLVAQIEREPALLIWSMIPAEDAESAPWSVLPGLW